MTEHLKSIGVTPSAVRSVDISRFQDFFSLPATFYTIQPDKAITTTAREYPIVDLSDYLTDFAETAAVMEQLDVIISVDTSVAHLAGALGRKLWLLLLRIPDFRWGAEGSTSYWYRSARLVSTSKLQRLVISSSAGEGRVGDRLPEV